MSGRERLEQVDLQHAEALATGVEIIDGFTGGLGARSHQDDHPLGIRRAEIIKQTIASPGQVGELVHRCFDNPRHLQIERIAGLAALEIGVRVLRGAADEGPVRIQGAGAMGQHQIVANHRPQFVIGQQGELVNLVRGAKAVEEVDERYPCFQRGGLGDQGHVVRFLHRTRGQQTEAGRAHCHHVLMIAEDRQALSGQRTRRDMEHRRGQLAGDLVHVGDHQHEPLRRGEGGGQRTGLQSAMRGTGGTGLALHFHHQRHAAPDVADPFRSPLVGQLAHG